jgi:hypothetical protein
MAMPASLGWEAERALVSALGEKLASSGTAMSLQGMSKADREEILALLSEIADFRYLEPATRPGGLTNVSGMHLRVETSVTAQDSSVRRRPPVTFCIKSVARYQPRRVCMPSTSAGVLRASAPSSGRNVATSVRQANNPPLHAAVRM